MALIWADKVAELSTTTGTGALALAGAITGYQAFAATMDVGDQCYYMITAVDSDGVPTGAWEAGLGTYSATDTLTRTEVHASSNAGAVVSLAAGTKRVTLSTTAASTYRFGGGGYGQVIGAGGTSGTAFATKGRQVTPLLNMRVTHAAFALTAVAGASYRASLVGMSGTTITSILDTDTWVSGVSASGTKMFSLLGDLVADQTYGILLTRTDSTTSYALPIAQATTGAYVWSGLPSSAFSGLTLASVNPSVSDACGAVTSAFSGDLVYGALY